MNPAVDPVDSFGPYEVYERLGMGGMAMVHRAKKRGIEGFERSLALKRMLQHLAEDAHFVDSFIREAKVSSLLHHPNIAQVYDFGRISGTYYIAMELVQGFDIRKLLRYASKCGESIPMPVLLSLLGELADALEYAHSFIDESGRALKIVHRDISPSNLIVAHSGHLKIIDFGIAKASSQQLHTESGHVKGKLGYMSPEAALGMQLDTVSDVFSMGVVAWELVTASPLFSARTDYETMRRIREADIAPPSFHNPSCPPELDAIILASLERDPDRRLPSAAVFRASIDALATQHGIHPSARHVAEWLVRFAQPGDQWVRSSAQPSRQQLPLPPEQVTSVQRRRTPSSSQSRPSAKLQRSVEQQKLATEIWGDDMPAMTSPTVGPDFSMAARDSPLTASLPPLVPQPLTSQPLANVPLYTPTQHPPPAASSSKWAFVVVAVLAVIGAALAVVLVLKPPAAPTVAAEGPVHFVIEPASALIEIAGSQVDRETELPAGVHAVTVKHDGYKPWTGSITVRVGESQTINVALERGLAHVSIDSEPRGLPVEVDGKRSGYTTPASFDLPAGTHKLAVTGKDGEVWTEELVAVVDGKHTFTAMLAKPTASPAAVASKDKPPKKDKPDKKPPKTSEVVEAKPEPPPEIVKPPEPPPQRTPEPPPPQKPAQPARTPVVAATAVTKLAGEIPKLKAAAGESNGDALVKMCIDESGKVTSVKVVKSTGAIASELSTALGTWRYKPYMNQDKQPSPVCFPLQLRLVFKRAD